MLYWREAAADRVGAKGTSQWQRTLVGGREDMAIPMCSSGHDHALRHGGEGIPCASRKGLCVGSGNRDHVFGVSGDAVCGEGGGDFFH